MESVSVCVLCLCLLCWWYTVCTPRRWLPTVCTSCTYPAGSECLVVLAVMDCWRERFNIRLTGITGLKLGLGLRGGGNALVENGKKRNDPTDKMCVGCSVQETIHSSCDAYWYKKSSLVNISTEELGTLRSQCWENDLVAFIKTSICYLKPLLMCMCVLWGQWRLCVELILLCACLAIFHVVKKKTTEKRQSFLKISTLSNCLRLSKKQAGVRWVNMSTVYNYSLVSSKIQQIIAVDDSQMNHCI